MPTYQKAGIELGRLADKILKRFESHRPLLDSRVTFDFVFAFPSLDENGSPTGNAISKNGVKALGLCRIVSLKDRAMGRADVEITLDHPWWEDASDNERDALLDHELHHAEVKTKNGVVMRDDLQRPMIRLRKHDVEIGWFDVVALRHGEFSQERIQAQRLYDDAGQLYWPAIAGEPAPELLKQARKSAAHEAFAGFRKLLKDHGAALTIQTEGMAPVTIGGEAA
jgi:hypothetical protein